MVKPDVKHNYYADLELPTNASIDDVRKAYRKLALQYHPDRNAGREGECVPKFQAIQQANEVLGDTAVKQKYDIDRRKAGLYPTTSAPTTFTPRQTTPGNPYAAASAYPPPPRRTQPNTWQQRPTPAAGAAGAAGGTTGADRFSSFPRPSHPTAKKDHAQDRANMFQAWQNMNNPQSRQSRFSAQQNAQQTPPPPQPQQPQSASAARARAQQPPQPPPRPNNTMPTEEQIRAGTKYRQPPPTPGVDGLDERQRAWQTFEQQGPKPGINRSYTTRTPKRQGFNPNTPGSDERAAPRTGGGYVHCNKSADFGKQRPFPPPPPGAPPPNQMPTSPLSPNISPTHTRPGTDPTRPDRTQAPFAEGNRNRTPYASFIGEKTDFGAEKMRRSFSTRDTSKLGPEDAANRSRARSSSPPATAPGSSARKPFVMYSSSSAASSSSEMAQPPEDYDSVTDRQRPGATPDTVHSNRPKKVPRAPSSRVNGNGAASGATSPMPPTPGAPEVNGNGTPAEDMQQKSKPSMYANPSPFDQKAWMAATFGSLSTSRAKQSRFKFPSWAIPGSVNPSLKRDKPAPVESLPYTTAADRVYVCATEDERKAYIRFQALLQEAFDHVPYNLDMSLFNTLIVRARRGLATGKPQLDQIVARLLREFPSVGAIDTKTNNNQADQARPANSFTFPNAADLFGSTAQKSRSVESINTKFSPDDWHGTFKGEPSYFGAPSRSPSRRPVNGRTASSQRRAATMEVWPFERDSVSAPVFGRTADSRQSMLTTSSKVPPTPANADGGEATQRRPSGSDGTFTPGEAPSQQTQEPASSQNPVVEEFDAMDIDNTPPAQRTADQAQQAGEQDKEARLYSVPPSAWRQQQEQAHQPTRHRTNSSANRRAQRAPASHATGAKLNTNLDDLRNVEPISRTAGPTVGGGFNNMTSMSEGLPFQSAPANSVPAETLKKLDIPTVPTFPERPGRWSKLSWHMYAEHFADYLKREHEFNKQMLSYFAVRLQSDERLITGSSSKAWLEASGVTQDGIGFDAYANDVEQDAAMRIAWDIGCERHQKAVKEFGQSREQVTRLARDGILPE